MKKQIFLSSNSFVVVVELKIKLILLVKEKQMDNG